MKVLVVDDSELVLQTTANALRAVGMEVITLTSALGAAQAIATHKPDAILIDLDMPALSGERAATILKRQRWTQDAKIILFSGKSREELEEARRRARADGIVSKSDGHEAIVAELRRLAPR